MSRKGRASANEEPTPKESSGSQRTQKAATGSDRNRSQTRRAASTQDDHRALSAPDERQRRIELAAYYRAERRGFEPGHELEDWLDAEAETE
jgi:hypothetical protein